MKKVLHGKRVLITGGTGSLGKVLTRRILTGEMGTPKKVVIFSRDEGKHHAMQMAYMKTRAATDDIVYRNFTRTVEFHLGDVRDTRALVPALGKADVVIHAAALKQVPNCEYFPEEAVETNVIGAENIVRAIRDYRLPIEILVGVSTDKAVKPVNVMGMTKALQERVLLRGNIDCPKTRIVLARYGNVLASRGSAIPLFLEQIRNGGPVTITDTGMTRFLMNLDQAVDAVFEAMRQARRGEIYIPIIKSAKITDMATALIGDRKIKQVVTGIRPGEKLHEILFSEEEGHRAFRRGNYYVIPSILPELQHAEYKGKKVVRREYSSADDLMTLPQVQALLAKNRLRLEDTFQGPDRRAAGREEELLR